MSKSKAKSKRVTPKKEVRPDENDDGLYFLNTDNCWVQYFNPIDKSIYVDKKLFEKLWQLHPEEQGSVKMFGKTVTTPRYQQTYGRDYRFSGIDHKALPIDDPYLKKILEYVNNHARSELDYDQPFNQIMVNWYDGGSHYIGAHSDDEKQLVPGSPIYSFSFGQTRDFVITNKKHIDEEKITISLPNNSLAIMCGDMQKHYKHEVLKSKEDGKRINITARSFSK